MNFNQLDTEIKEEFHKDILEKATSVGGKNFFLQMLEDIRAEKPNMLLRKNRNFHYDKGKIIWNKSIYKNTLDLLFEAVRKEDRDGDMLDGLKPREQKNITNTMRTLKPIEFTIMTKNVENATGFKFSILDENNKISLMFKVICFYNLDFAKKALNYQKREN